MGWIKKERWLSLLLVLAMCLGLMSTAFAADGDVLVVPDEEIVFTTSDGMAFGEDAGILENDQFAEWVNRAVATDSMKSLINQETLYPQRTGWKELDNEIAKLLQPYAGADTYTKLWGAYDALVKNVTYSWSGYSTTKAPAYTKFTANYLSGLHYEEGLQKSIPDDMANRTYHILTKKIGVCYDYAIAMAVIARYIGIEAYVHTGYFVFEDTSLGSGHHGWSILVLGGQKYVFDPQRDARNYQYNHTTGYYFGIPVDTATKTSYVPSYDATANTNRDASMLPVKNFRNFNAKITCTKQGGGSGTISGPTSAATNTTAKLTATPDSGSVFAGWYDKDGKQITDQTAYSFTVVGDTELYPKFLKKLTHTITASRSGKASGTTASIEGEEITATAVPSEGKTFAGWYNAGGEKLSSELTYTVAPTKNMTLIAMMEGDVFYDIPANAWYLSEAMTAVEKKMVNGTTPITFNPDMKLTRGMAVTILARISGAELSKLGNCPFIDVADGAYYKDAVTWAYYQGVVKGTDAKHFAPDATITRQEFMTILARYLTNVAGVTLPKPGSEISYKDKADIADWALEAVCQIDAIGIVKGYPDGTIGPENTLSRAEGVALLVRLAEYISENA